MYKILVSDPIADKGIALLEDAECDVIYNPNPSVDELQSYMSDIDAWIVRSGTQITSDYLKDARNLQIIGRAGVGTDNIDIDSGIYDSFDEYDVVITTTEVWELK